MNVKIKFGLLLIFFSQASCKKIAVNNKSTSSSTEGSKYEETTEMLSTTTTINEIETTEFSDFDTTKTETKESITTESSTGKNENSTSTENSSKSPEVTSFLNTMNKAMQKIEKTNFTQIYNKKGPSSESKNRKKRDVDPCKPKGPSCSKEGTFRFKQNCKKYYVCYFDSQCKKLLPKIYTCPKCLKFNAQKNICDLAENVPECSNSNSGPKKYCTNPGRFFVPDNCQKYYECTVNGSLIDLTIKMCPPETVFSRKELKCLKGQKCKESGPNCATDDSYAVDMFDCSKFYYCVTKNFSVPLYCPSSYVFNNKVCEKWESIKLKWDNPKAQKSKNN
ncbi:uncharacterized protein LOC123011592 [Tribolium madens]|uniref:uncharacterized protein LOC123011592 n=1 Tax=Tribolium madens TaxID=41895 RepID=UPI001CF75DB7|nr:uncharacterized protein LOC123011592 [Tribolium madens]